MLSFYWLSTIAGIIIGTVFVIFLSKALQNSKATVLNALLLNVLFVVMFWVASFVLPDNPFVVIVILIVEFFIIKAIYQTDYFNTFLFLIIATIFPNVFTWVLVQPFVELLSNILY